VRLIYQNGKQIGSAAIDSYVYLWRHGEIDIYVGKGVNGRWTSHLKYSRNGGNQPKCIYFRDHGPELSCFILAEGMSDTEAGNMEIAEIAQRGLKIRGTGTLLNDRDGSAIYGPKGKRDIRSMGLPHQRWIAQRDRGPLAPDTSIRRAGRALYNNPKKPGCGGAEYIDHCYPPAGVTITIEELMAKGRAEGFTDRQQHGHLAWDLTHGFIEVVLPESEQVEPGHTFADAVTFEPTRLD
jgi:hypothetical protein